MSIDFSGQLGFCWDVISSAFGPSESGKVSEKKSLEKSEVFDTPDSETEQEKDSEYHVLVDLAGGKSQYNRLDSLDLSCEERGFWWNNLNSIPLEVIKASVTKIKRDDDTRCLIVKFKVNDDKRGISALFTKNQCERFMSHDLISGGGASLDLNIMKLKSRTYEGKSYEDVYNGLYHKLLTTGRVEGNGICIELQR